MPAVRVVILDKVVPGSFKYVLWADVPAARQQFYASTGKVSAYLNATSSQNAALQSGAVVEKVDYIWTPGISIPNLEVELESRWNAYQTDVTNRNDWNFYGSNWNGTAWSTQGAA